MISLPGDDIVNWL